MPRLRLDKPYLEPGESLVLVTIRLPQSTIDKLESMEMRELVTRCLRGHVVANRSEVLRVCIELGIIRLESGLSDDE